jgi:hypothetical protein
MRKPKPALQRSSPVLASEIDLRCKQFKPGTREVCGAPATGYVAPVGDSCDRCARGRRMIRYAIARRLSAKVAA